MVNSFNLSKIIPLHQGVLQLVVNQNLSQRGLNKSAPGSGQLCGACKSKSAFHILQGHVNKST